MMKKYYPLALKIATDAHKDQKRKRDGEDYINHPIRIAEKFKHCNGLNSADLLMSVNLDFQKA